jgi:hypothetical protein
MEVDDEQNFENKVPFSVAFSAKQIDDLIYRVHSLVSKSRYTVDRALKVALNYDLTYYEVLRGRYRYFRRPKRGKKDNRILTDEQEAALMGRLQAYSRLGQAWSMAQVVAEVIEISGLSDNWDGSNWFRRFKERSHSQLWFSSSKTIDASRIYDVSDESIEDFMVQSAKLAENTKLQPCFVFNIDESPCDALRSTLKVMLDRNALHTGVIKLPWDSLRTIVPVVAADGSIFMILFIYQDGSKKAPPLSMKPWMGSQNRNGLRSSIDYYYATTSKGYMIKELWKMLIDKFVEKLTPIKNGADALVYMDRLASHLDLESTKKLVEHGIEVLFLPPHTTHRIQPLDQAPLANFKRALCREKHGELHRRLNQEEP